MACSALTDTLQASEGARERNGYSSQRDVQDLRDFPVAEALRAQHKAALIRLRQGIEDCSELLLLLHTRQLFFRVQSWITALIGCRLVSLLLQCDAPLQT